MKLTSLRALPAVALLALTATAAAAQVAPTPRGLGMGGAYIATARGHEALFLNPANLALPGTPYWSIAAPQLVAVAGASGPTIQQAWELLQGTGNSAERRAELLDLVPVDGMALDLDLRLPLFAIQSRRLVFGVAYGAVAEHTLGRDLVELFLEGYEPGRADYAADETVGSRATFLDFAVGYGRSAGPLSVGVTAHYLRGRTLSRSRLFEPLIDPAAETIEVEYREVLVRGGSGWALDVGAAFQPMPNVTLSAAVSNFAGRMQWSDELLTRGMTLTQDDFGGSNMDWEDRITRFRSADESLDPSSAPLTVLETAEGLFDEARFPATLQAGAAYHLPQTRTHLEAGYRKRLTSGRLGGGWDETVSLGVQQKIPLLTLRAGVASDRDGGSLLSGGLTLGAMELGLARVREAHDATAGREAWIAAVGLNIGTRTLMR